MIGAFPRLIAVARNAAGKPVQPGVKAAQIAQIAAALRVPSPGKCLRKFIAAPGQFSLAGEQLFGGGRTFKRLDPRDVTDTLQPLQPEQAVFGRFHEPRFSRSAETHSSSA